MLKYVIFRFSEAGLPIRLLAGPLRNSDRRIFKMEILRNGADEYFRLWPGRPGLRLDVPGVDRSLRQAIRAVHEPEVKLGIGSTNAKPAGDQSGSSGWGDPGQVQSGRGSGAVGARDATQEPISAVAWGRRRRLPGAPSGPEGPTRPGI